MHVVSFYMSHVGFPIIIWRISLKPCTVFVVSSAEVFPPWLQRIPSAILCGFISMNATAIVIFMALVTSSILVPRQSIDTESDCHWVYIVMLYRLYDILMRISRNVAFKKTQICRYRFAQKKSKRVKDIAGYSVGKMFQGFQGFPAEVRTLQDPPLCR